MTKTIPKLGYILLGFIFALTLSLLPIKTFSQPINQARIVEILDSDQVFIQNQRVRVNAVARQGQQIRTGQARASLRFDNNAVLRLGRNSSFIVGSRCVQLQRGQVVVSGNAQGCVGSVVAVTRGTIYVMEIDEETEESMIQVLEGVIEVFESEQDTDDPDYKEGQILEAGNQIRVFSDGILGQIERIRSNQLTNLLQGQLFRGFRIPLPNFENIIRPLSGRGFTPNFIRQAINGISNPLGHLSNRRTPSRFTPNLPLTDTEFLSEIGNDATLITGSFTVNEYGTSIGNQLFRDSGTFQDDSGKINVTITTERGNQPTRVNLSSPIEINGTVISPNATQTGALINGIPAQNVTFGLSGNDAILTVIGQDGQVFQVRVFGVNNQQPQGGDRLPGAFILGPLPDR
ncbi:FecR family protein [Spirulina subsalsa FACHB-351]|uniref:FecR family protein n=1 Tax=Spirulina subsalsa FACHB-351 TaxID=234711 RepID=A0ABT3L437_9CYAN|nr:FecR family protein [Spirulina subsalsa]MCW6036271.1 FecR family protein [Spirulina subsalsa FACHB-351]